MSVNEAALLSAYGEFLVVLEHGEKAPESVVKRRLSPFRLGDYPRSDSVNVGSRVLRRSQSKCQSAALAADPEPDKHAGRAKGQHDHTGGLRNGLPRQ